jgi:hypothetical protein
MVMSSTNPTRDISRGFGRCPPGQPASFCHAESLRLPCCRHPHLICGAGASVERPWRGQDHYAA